MTKPLIERTPLERAAWLVPPLACLAIYWYSLQTWFHQDDFAWLGLHLHVQSWRDLPEVLFSPQAQGTMRPWSERVFFLVFQKLFGWNAVPFHLWVFGTQVLNLLLVQSVVRHMTGSWVAGVLTCLLWLVNPGLATPMSWTSSYNQILCCFFLLAALRLLMKAQETGRRRDWSATWGVFLLGFGGLEINVVFPALAAAYTFLFARQHLLRVLPMFLVSAAYTALHYAVATKPTEGVYAQYWGLSMVRTLAIYGKLGAGAFDLDGLLGLPKVFWATAAWVLVAGILAALAWAVRLRDWVPVFGAAWFVIVLAPVLPLRDHVIDYYLAIPTLGLAMILSWAVFRVWSSGARGLAMLALVPCAAYVGMTLPKTMETIHWRYGLGQLARGIVMGVKEAHERYPDRMILLTGITTEAFWFGIFDNPFRLYGPVQLYLAPGEEKTLTPHPELGDITPWLAPRNEALRNLHKGRAVVFQWNGNRLEETTAAYRTAALREYRSEAEVFIDVGRPEFEDSLGKGWYGIENGYRWMGKTAEVRLAGMKGIPGEIWLSGYCPAELLKQGPLEVVVRANQIVLGRLKLIEAKANFEENLTLPDRLASSEVLQVSVEVARTLRVPGDPRELGLAFGKFGVRRRGTGGEVEKK